jgi:hypothetical protein
MNENFLHFVWKYRTYHPGVETTEGQALEVIQPGHHNKNAGPDFSNARIKIDETLWAGNVEIHVKASDWYAHNHQEDAAYANVILHVVLENDRPVLDSNNHPIPTLELKGVIFEDVYKKYFYYINNQLWVPCEKDIARVDPITMNGWMERLFIERIERKTDVLKTLYSHNGNSLSETFYQVLAGNFGLKTNEQPFQMLSRLLPLSVLGKHKNNLFQIEAMMFGCSGLLGDDFSDEYPNQLFQEFMFLKKKYGLITMEGHVWKFLRLRPGNFPTVRISQLAALVHKSEHLFSKILEVKNIEELKSFFCVKASEYWEDHYNFDRLSKKKTKTLGDTAIDNLVLNTVVQFLFFYSQLKDDPVYRDQAINFMLDLKPENNHIIKRWDVLGIKAQNAFESQALLELKNRYCKQKQCLQCSIGTKLLRQSVKA